MIIGNAVVKITVSKPITSEQAEVLIARPPYQVLALTSRQKFASVPSQRQVRQARELTTNQFLQHAL